MDSPINPLKDPDPHCPTGLLTTYRPECQINPGMDPKGPQNGPSIGSPQGSLIQFYNMPTPNSHSNNTKKFLTNNDQNLNLNIADCQSL